MKIIYQKWIVSNYPTPESAKTACAEATRKMVDCFPELSRVRGMISVFEPFGLPASKTTHWWCVDSAGEIVDPTAHQYPTHILNYSPIDETKGEPTGKCPNCGDLCYNGDYLCTSKCERDYMAYLNS